MARHETRLRLLALASAGSAAAMSLAGCGAVVPATDTQVPVPLDGVTTCRGADDPVAVFWGSDQGVGWPGNGPDAPSGGDVWAVAADGPMRALTNDSRSLDPWLSDDARRVYFTRSNGGMVGDAAAPGTEIWLLDLVTGEESMLFESLSDDVDVNHPEASPDGSAIAFDSPGGTPVRQHVYVLDVNGDDEPTEVPLGSGDGFQGQQEPTWSPDGSMLAFIHSSVQESDLLVWSSIRTVDLQTKEQATVYEPQEPGGFRSLEWMPGGTSLLVTQLAEEGEDGIDIGETAIEIDIASGKSTPLVDGVVFGATYAGPDTLREIGPTLEELQQMDEPPTPKLVTWHAGEPSRAADPTVADTPVQLSFAEGLNFASCSFDAQGE